MTGVTRKPAAAALTLLATLGFVAACEDEETSGPEAGAEVEDVAEDDTIYDEEFGVYKGDQLNEFEDRTQPGRIVTVSADINRFVEPGKSFVMGEGVSEDGLLVVMPSQLTDVPPLEEGMAVQVVATVVNFDAANLETDYPSLELDDKQYDGWNDDSALVARAITEAPPES